MKRNNLQLLLAGLFVLTATARPQATSARSLASQAQSPHLSLMATGFQQPPRHNLDFPDSELIISKKSGGRSGGGSFKSRPSRSSSSSPSRSSQPPKASTPSHRNYNQSYPSDRQYNAPSYNHNSISYPRTSSRNGGSLMGFLMLLIFLAGFLVLLVYIFHQLLGNQNAGSNTGNKITQERANNRVTVSLLQVVLSSGALNLQQDLTELSTTVDTSNDPGLVELMREAVLLLVRNEQYWTHVFSSSQSLDISQAKSEFERLSLIQRSKFSNESLSNINGQLKTQKSREEASDGFADYLVVTLLLGTADDQPLFNQINTADSLSESLIELAALREDYLIKVEVLWTPQTANQYLTDEELLLEYTEVIPIS